MNNSFDRIGPPPISASESGEVHVTSSGLTSQTAAERLQRDGPNVLPQPERRRYWKIVANVLREPMVLLLLGGTTVYLLLGDPREAALLAVSVLLVIALTVYQEQKSERALQALRDLSSPRARVLRDGELRTVAGAEVVVGDVILVAEGDRIPADARVIEEADLHVDESMLTGESVPVHRGVTSEAETDESTLLHASTLVVRGHGTAEVVATGVLTAVGRIGTALGTIKPEATPMQREMRRIVALFAALGLASCALMTGLYYATRGGWLDALLAGITLAMANIPEEFPLVLTVFLALGAWRMAGHKALVRRTPAIEALGSITVLCTDKTGTLTENRMAVAEVVVDGKPPGVDPSASTSRMLLETAALASAPESHDPMDRALQESIAAGQELTTRKMQHVHEYPLSPECPAVTHAWLRQDATELVIACKGAPETVADLCRLSPTKRSSVLAEVDAMARRGLRVLAVASTSWPDDEKTATSSLPSSMRDIGLEWRGLVAFADPLRAGVSSAVGEAHTAGIRVIMLTGDHLETARAIATQAGLVERSDVALGRDIEALDDEALVQRIAGVNVFARVRPENKLRLVKALKGAGQVVAMTGDGVNDAPALMASHVGIAMGGRGTDVAREAASIVLLDDNFVTVVSSIRIGRTIYDNIRRAVRYILAVHVPITGLALLPMVTGGPLVLLPLHVVFLELIIDPACSFVFEREPPASDIMQRPPRTPAERLLGLRSLLASLAQGAVMFAVVVAVYAMGFGLDLPPAELGALAFTSLVAGNLGLILLYRAGTSVWNTLRQPNPAFWGVAVVTLLVLAVVTRFGVPASWFGFVPPPVGPWLFALLLPLLVATLLNALPNKGRYKS